MLRVQNCDKMYSYTADDKNIKYQFIAKISVYSRTVFITIHYFDPLKTRLPNYKAICTVVKTAGTSHGAILAIYA